MDIPSIDTLKHVGERLKANDISWFKERFKAGEFSWLKDRLPEGGYTKLGEKIEAGDLGYVRTLFGGLDLPGFGAIFGGAGKAVGAVGAAVAGAGAAGLAGASAAKAAAGTGAAKVAGAAGAAGAAAKGVVINDERDRKKGAIWLLPVALLAALGIGYGISRLAKDDKKVAADSAVATDSTAETAAATEAPVETAAATEAPVETVAATEAPVETTAASVAETSAAADPAAGAGTIVDVATKAGNFKTLLAAANAAGLVETLNGPGPLTVFAPSDDAFAKLPPGLVDALVKPENKDTLAKILTYHVVPGKVMAADIKPGDVATAQGGTIKLATDGGVTINGVAKVTTADVPASNGVIHVIDTVLSSAELEGLKVIGFPPADAAAPADTTAAAAAPDLTKENKAGDATPEDLTVYFDSGSDKVNAAGQAKVDGAVKILSALPAGSKVALVGRADKTGNAAQNLRLSTRRAKNVLAAITAGLGDKASNITFTTDAKGDEEQIDDLAAARRVTIEIAK